MEKGVSEYQMSLDLGMSKGYIQSISSGKACPSLKLLFSICEYFGITPRDFFDEEPDKNQSQNAMWRKLDRLDASDLRLLDGLVDHLIALHDK